MRQTQARQLQSGNTPPNPQMQAMTKVFPVFFAVICLGLNAGATIYFVVSNIWRIGQQHLVINKLYDEVVPTAGSKGAGDKATTAKDEPSDSDTSKNGSGNGAGAKGAKGSQAKGPAPKGSSSNGNGAKQPTSSGARRKKKRKR